jgi:hypothetical protein
MWSLEKNKSSFKARERTDPQFCSKFMYAIDTYYQLWLEECMLQTQQNCVDDNILHFQPLIEQVHFGTFELKLPSVFSAPPPPKPDDGAAAANQKGQGNKGNQDAVEGKKKKGQQQQEREKKDEYSKRTPNPNPIEAFQMREGKTWRKTFAHKNVRGRVPWGPNDCKMCPRWYILNYCFKNCFHVASHVRGSKVPADKIAAFVKYMTMIRGAAN